MKDRPLESREDLNASVASLPVSTLPPFLTNRLSKLVAVVPRASVDELDVVELGACTCGSSTDTVMPAMFWSFVICSTDTSAASTPRDAATAFVIASAW